MGRFAAAAGGVTGRRMDGFRVAGRRARDGTATVAVRGELGIGTIGEVRRVLDVAQASGPPVLALDLREVDHLDSTGLRVIIDAASRASSEGRRVVVVAPPQGPVGRVLQLTLVADHLEVVDDAAAVDP
jgi:anti-anti-sigma factor